MRYFLPRDAAHSGRAMTLSISAYGTRGAAPISFGTLKPAAGMPGNNDAMRRVIALPELVIFALRKLAVRRAKAATVASEAKKRVVIDYAQACCFLIRAFRCQPAAMPADAAYAERWHFAPRSEVQGTATEAILLLTTLRGSRSLRH